MDIARDAMAHSREVQRAERLAAKPLWIERGRMTLLGREGIAVIGAGVQKRLWRGRRRALAVHTAPEACDALPPCEYTPKALSHATQAFLLDVKPPPAASPQLWPGYTLLPTSRPHTPANSCPIRPTAPHIVAKVLAATKTLSIGPTSRDVARNLVRELRRPTGA